MRHQRAGKKLGRDSSHRKALYSNLAGALITHGRIETTEAKAKAVKPFAEKMITLGKGATSLRAGWRSRSCARRTSSTSFTEVGAMLRGAGPRLHAIVKLGPRQGDAPTWSPRAGGLPP